MIIDVFKLKSKGKEEETFTFSFDLDESLLSIPWARFSSPAKMNALVEVYPDEVYISGTLCYEITAPCSRCLKEATVSRAITFDDRFLPENRSDEEEDPALIYTHDRIDLNHYVNELILTDMPLTLLCKEDCKGLCPVCGQDLNEKDCGHHI